MSDGIEIPVAASKTIATDEVDLGSGLQHVQVMKLVDGTDGGTARHRIFESGAASEVSEVFLFGDAISDAGAGGYTAGQVIGTAIVLTNVPSGFYEVGLSVAHLAGTTLPSIATILLAGANDTPPAVPADGDPLTDLPILAALSAIRVDTEPSGVNPAVRRSGSTGRLVVSDGASAMAGSVLSSLTVMLVAAEDIAADLSGTIVAGGAMRLIGEQPVIA